MQAKRLILTLSTLLVLCFAVVGVVQAAATKSAPKAGKPAAKAGAKASAPKAKITATQAEKIALKKYPGKITEKTQLENEEGVWQYSVMIQSDKTLREVMVNAQTGKIDNVEVTSAEKEKNEGAKDKAKEKDEEKEGSEGTESN